MSRVPRKGRFAIGAVAGLTATFMFAAGALADHCNSYRGPAGQVPPTGRTPNDPTPPPAGGGGTTGGTGGTGGATTPGPTTGGGGVTGPRTGLPRAATPGRGGRRASGAEGFERWEFWWEYNKDALLNLRSRLVSETASGSSDFFLGSEDKTNAKNVTRPTERVIRETVLPELVKATEDNYYLVRDAAVLSLGKIGDPSSLPVLVKMLKDEHREVQESAALALGLLGNHDALQTLISLMNDDENSHKITSRREILTRTRGFAAVGLGLLGDEQAVPALLEALDKSEPQKDVQVCAAIALGILKAKGSVDKLCGIVKNDSADEFVRAYAATSLGKIGDEKAIPVLEEALKDKSLHVSRSAVMALSLFGGDAAERIVSKVKEVAEKGRDPQSKNWAMITLGRLGGTTAKKTLLEALENEQRSTQAFAALGLALFGMKSPDPAIVDSLRKTFEGVKDASVQGAFAIALGLLSDKGSEANLLELVKGQGAADLRGYAAIGLGLMRARNATPVIESVVKETNEPSLQRSGAMALGLMADRNVVNLLAGVLKTATNEFVLSSSAMALGTIGDHTAVEPLLQCVKGTTGSKITDTARAYAATALGILGEPTDVPKLSMVSRDVNYRAQIDAVKTLLNLL